ncbi:MULTISPECIES: VOC family protein [unclassified Kitasatospora]|uniref:VOC family protein n=1 Tax=unclassified Kitasatospora TaxID=2633591 RepID=UPI00070A0E4F|nr:MULTISPECIES: VOC family protein [unclassified Kitasatospora]KQV09876.1 glyoxalase [Kitasatospora sp. Root107]KRB70116.1 glyoxalase [Kitasatospora sp. Root187]
MPTMIFVNLPVKNLDKSIGFFEAMGYSFNPQFTDETASCLVISDTIYAMLVTEARFKDFTRKPVADATAATEVIVALSADSRAEVDELVDKAMAAGGRSAIDPMDLGFMYSRSFQDLDGHQWEYVWMDEAAMAEQQSSS